MRLLRNNTILIVFGIATERQQQQNGKFIQAANFCEINPFVCTELIWLLFRVTTNQ